MQDLRSFKNNKKKEDNKPSALVVPHSYLGRWVAACGLKTWLVENAPQQLS